MMHVISQIALLATCAWMFIVGCRLGFHKKAKLVETNQVIAAVGTVLTGTIMIGCSVITMAIMWTAGG